MFSNVLVSIIFAVFVTTVSVASDERISGFNETEDAPSLENFDLQNELLGVGNLISALNRFLQNAEDIELPHYKTSFSPMNIRLAAAQLIEGLFHTFTKIANKLTQLDVDITRIQRITKRALDLLFNYNSPTKITQLSATLFTHAWKFVVEEVSNLPTETLELVNIAYQNITDLDAAIDYQRSLTVQETDKTGGWYSPEGALEFIDCSRTFLQVLREKSKTVAEQLKDVDTSFKLISTETAKFIDTRFLMYDVLMETVDNCSYIQLVVQSYLKVSEAFVIPGMYELSDIATLEDEILRKELLETLEFSYVNGKSIEDVVEDTKKKLDGSLNNLREKLRLKINITNNLPFTMATVSAIQPHTENT